jgi:hypothetical protein
MPSVIDLLRKSFLFYRTHFILFAGYAAWLLLLYAGIILVNLSGQPENIWIQITTTFFELLQFFLASWVAVIVILLTKELLIENKQISLLSIQETAWKYFPSVLFVSILQTTVIFGGIILFIIPAFIFSIWFSFTQMAVLLDNQKGIRALSFSRECVRGHFWSVAWRIFLGPAAILFAYACVINLLIALVAGITHTPIETWIDTPPIWMDVIASVTEIFLFPIFMIYTTYLYLALKGEKTVLSDDKNK